MKMPKVLKDFLEQLGPEFKDEVRKWACSGRAACDIIWAVRLVEVPKKKQLLIWQVGTDYLDRSGRRMRYMAMTDDGRLLMASVDKDGQTVGSFVSVVDNDGRYYCDRTSDYDILRLWKEPPCRRCVKMLKQHDDQKYELRVGDDYDHAVWAEVGSAWVVEGQFAVADETEDE